MNCNCGLLLGRRIDALPPGLRPRIFAGLAGPDLSSILSLARHRRFAAGTVVLRQGDLADQIFVLTSGQGAHFVETAEGRKILIYWLTAGQVFGGMALLPNSAQYLVGTEVRTPSCALVWSRQAIRSVVLQYPVLLDNALSIAATEHVAWLLAARVSLGTEEAPARVARLLVSLACGIGRTVAGGTEILVANEDLAGGAGVTPYTISRLIAGWQRAGILTKGRGRIIFRRPELLAAMLDEPGSPPGRLTRSVA